MLVGFAFGLIIGAVVAALVWYRLVLERRTSARLTTLLDSARRQRANAEEGANHAHDELRLVRDRLAESEQRLAQTRLGVRQVAARLESFEANPVPAPQPAAPVEGDYTAQELSASLGRHESEAVRLRRQLAEQVVEADRLRRTNVLAAPLSEPSLDLDELARWWRGDALSPA